jgi:tRNA (guanine37-N1)-methyltransferase
VKITILTLFPDSVVPLLNSSILGRAQQAGVFAAEAVDLRRFATDKHKTTDDSPAGGGAGMVLRVDVVARALEAVRGPVVHGPAPHPTRVLLLDARGRVFSQTDARRLASPTHPGGVGPGGHLILVCGRYEGVDARVFSLVDELTSVGDMVLTGGELPALVVIDAVVRLLPGALGNAQSAVHESHGTDGLLEHRHYTRPVAFGGQGIPPVLLGGDHKKIDAARRKDMLLLTRRHRPDLLVGRLSKVDDKLLADDKVASLDPVAVVGADGAEA